MNEKKEIPFIPYGRQWIDEDDIRAVIETLRSDCIARGPKSKEFEHALCSLTNAKHAVLVNSGTSALHIACLVAGVSPGDEVITSPITFVASANCAVYCGATPVFADIDSRTYNISSVEIEKKITEKTKAVIPVHFAGQSCDMESLRTIVQNAEKKYGHKIWIIEDACHVLDSRYKGEQVGSCTRSDMAIMSFHPVKHITTGEGGVVFTNDKVTAEKLERLRGHGITRDPRLLTHNPGFWYHEQIDLGYNYFITDFQSALGTSQLKKLPRFSHRRREIVKCYNEAFAHMEGMQIPFESRDNDSIFHLYVPLIDFNALKTDRRVFMEKLKNLGILTQVHYIPVHTQPFYQKHFGTKWGDFPKAEAYYQQCLSLPLYPAMEDSDVEYVIHAVKSVVQKV